jgi:hypothetical protein
MAGVRTIRRGDTRYYVDPQDGDKKVPGVTSVLGMLPKGFLTYWAAKEVATTAVDDLGAVVNIALRDPSAAIDYLKRAPQRNTGRAADVGTAAHDLFERLARGEAVRRVHPDMEPFRRHFEDFLEANQPEFLFLEETVWSDVRGYAGSFDAIARIDDETVIIDWKTTRSGVHEEVALQLKAYAMADRIILAATGDSVPMPAVDAAAVLHVRPEGAQLVPVDCSDDLLDYFTALLTVFQWDSVRKRSVIGRPTWTTGAVETGTQRRAA